MSEVLTREIDALRLLMGSPRDPHGRVFAQLGDALRRAGALREALDVLLDGVSEHPNFAPGHLVLGWTAQEAGDFEVARTAYERTVELDPENPNGLFGLGRLLDRDGDSRGASLIEEAESLDARVHDVAPGFPGLRALHDPPAAQDDSLAALPFMSLAELAPQPSDTDPDDLADLPFVALDDLAPDADAHDPEGLPGVVGGAPAADDLSELPFVPLDDLRPDETPVEAEVESSVGEGSPEEDGGPEVLAGPLATRTMGELLVRQGLTAQAIEVFETLVARSPEDEELRHRLGELRESLAPGSTAAVAGEAVEAEGGSEHPEALEGLGADGPDALDEEEELATHPSMDPPVPHPEMPSPFDPGRGEDDEVAEDEGQTVGDYFARLLSWSPARADEEAQASGEPSEGEEPTSS